MKKAIYYIILILICFNTASAKTVFDQLNRKINIPDNPERVISLAPNVTEIIFALKEEKRLIAATTFSDYPPAAKRLPKIGSYTRLDIEKIISLKPDLCIGIKEGNPKRVIDRLSEFEIPIYAVNNRSLASIIGSVLEIGDILNASDTAELVADKMRKRIEKVETVTSNGLSRPSVFFQIDTNAIISAGSDTFIHQLIMTAGGRNAAENMKGYPKFNKEHVLTLSPDIIVIASMEKNESFRYAELKWREFKNIPAVKNDRIFFVNADLFSRPSPRIIDGLEQLSAIIRRVNVKKADE